MKLFPLWRRGDADATSEELHRADQWLHDAFQRDTKRIANEMPRGLLERCLRITRRGEAPAGSHAWLAHHAWGWAAVVLLAALVAIVILRTGRPENPAVARKSAAPRQTATGQAPLVTRPEHSRPSQPQRGMDLTEKHVAQGDSPPVISRRQHSMDSTRRTNELVQRSGPRRDAGNLSGSTEDGAGGEVVAQAVQDGGIMAEWSLESPVSGEPARGTAYVSSGGAAPGSVASVATVASNLVPNATYAVLIQFAGTSEPVLMDRVRADTSGALQLSIDLTPDRIEALRQEIAANQPRETETPAEGGMTPNTPAGSNPSAARVDLGTAVLPGVLGVLVRSETGETALQPSTTLRAH